MSIEDLTGLLGSRAVIVLLGDSLTQRGFQERGWAGQLADHYGRRADVFNRGYGGYNSRWGRYIVSSMFSHDRRVREEISTNQKRGKYLLATIWFGANDASVEGQRAHVPVLEYADNIQAMIDHLQYFFLYIVVMSPPPIHEEKRLGFKRNQFGRDSEEGNLIDRSTDLAGIYARAAEKVVEKSVTSEKNLFFLDIWKLMLDEGDEMWNTYLIEDGLHLSPKGNDFVAQKLMELLDVHIMEVESLPSELPWGFEVNAQDFTKSFHEHQVKYMTQRVGLGEMFLWKENAGRDSTKNNMYLFVIVVWLSLAIYTLVSYFRNYGYFGLQKQN